MARTLGRPGVAPTASRSQDPRGTEVLSELWTFGIEATIFGVEAMFFGVEATIFGVEAMDARLKP